MPTYEYVCTACAHRLEVVQSFTDASLTDCPSCAGRLRKVFSPVGVVFKGSGFYKTDSRQQSTSGTARSDPPRDDSSATGAGSDAGKRDSGTSDSAPSGGKTDAAKSDGASGSVKPDGAKAAPAASTATTGGTGG